jgi:hypothetical protein
LPSFEILLILLNILLDGLPVSVDLHKEDAFHIVRDIESHRLVHNVNRDPIQDFTGGEGNPRGDDFFSRLSCIFCRFQE